MEFFESCFLIGQNLHRRGRLRSRILFVTIFFSIFFSNIFRIPIPLSKKLGKLTARHRWFAIVYIAGMFFILPEIFVGLTFIDSKGIAMYTFLAISAFITIIVVTINHMQNHEKLHQCLPIKLQTWDFLPEPMRSLDPYDRYVQNLLN